MSDVVGIVPTRREVDFEVRELIVHGAAEPNGLSLKRRTAESRERYYEEKIAELVLVQRQLAQTIAERDALALEFREIKRITQTYNRPGRLDTWKWLNEIGDIAVKVLEKLASGELRKLTA